MIINVKRKTLATKNKRFIVNLRIMVCQNTVGAPPIP
jgi:hypothetical protein